MGRSLSVEMQTLSPAENDVATMPAEGLIVKYTSSAESGGAGPKGRACDRGRKSKARLARVSGGRGRGEAGETRARAQDNGSRNGAR